MTIDSFQNHGFPSLFADILLFVLAYSTLFSHSPVQDIPFGKVEAREFLEPCKAIATLQIARDLRNDAAVQLSSLLAALPEEVTAFAKEQQKSNVGGSGTDAAATPQKDIGKDDARQFSIAIKEELLDLDIDEQLQNVRTYRGIVARQLEARKRLLYLLIRSRCQFGSMESAEAYYGMNTSLQKVNKRKGLFADALALEGIDVDVNELASIPANKNDGGDGMSPSDKNSNGNLPDLTWYLEHKNVSKGVDAPSWNPDSTSIEEPAAKKQKT